MHDHAAAADFVRLRDGRRLAYSAAGPADGFPVLYLHGAIGSPFRRSPELDAVIARFGLRYVMVSRPGFGASEASPGRTLLDLARDVEDLADALGHERLALVGVSAGGPYALACAHELGDRVTAAAVVSSLSHLCPPYATPGLPLRMRLALGLLARAPNACERGGSAALALVRRHPEVLLRVMVSGAPEADRRLLDEGPTARTAVDSFLAATAGGVRGLIDDYLVCTRPWGFEPGAIWPEIQVWHGSRDALVPVEHALQLAGALPRCRIALDPNEGHFFFRRRVEDILGALVGSRPAAPVRAEPARDRVGR